MVASTFGECGDWSPLLHGACGKDTLALEQALPKAAISRRTPNAPRVSDDLVSIKFLGQEMAEQEHVRLLNRLVANQSSERK